MQQGHSGPTVLRGRTAAVTIAALVVSVVLSPPVAARTLPAGVPPGAARGLPDVSVTGDTPAVEDEPSVAVNPAHPDFLVAGVQHLSGTCSYYESRNAGATWQGPFEAPLTPGAATCYDISVRAAPDGAYFYMSYLSIQGSEFVSDVAVFRIKGDFSGTKGPFIALHRRPAIIDKDWIDVHESDTSQAANVFVTATYFSPDDRCVMLFARSANYGRSWSKPRRLARYAGCTFDNPSELGARPLGGPGQALLVCWYNAGSDWGPGHGGGGPFGIACTYSADDGATFGPVFDAVTNESNELPYQSCPKGKYQRIWSAMFPAMSVGPDGSMHITYTTDPTNGTRDGECGDIRYVRSSAPPYDTWSQPITVAGGSAAQTFSTIVAVPGAGGGCDVHIAYMSGQTSPSRRVNRHYDVYRVESNDCGLTWGAPIRVSSRSSLASDDFIGDYIDITAAAVGSVHVVWTDRRDERDISDPESDVFTNVWAP